MAYHCVLLAGVMVLKVNDLNLVKCMESMESLCLSAMYINVAKDSVRLFTRNTQANPRLLYSLSVMAHDRFYKRFY